MQPSVDASWGHASFTTWPTLYTTSGKRMERMSQKMSRTRMDSADRAKRKDGIIRTERGRSSIYLQNLIL